MHPIAQLFEHLNIAIPCNQSGRCSSCRNISRAFSKNNISTASVNLLWYRMVTSPPSQSCSTLQELHSATEGNIICLDFCPDCQLQTLRGWNHDPIQSCNIYSSKTVIPFSGLGLFKVNGLTKCNHQRMMSYQAFGDIPKLVLLRFDSESASTAGRVCAASSADPRVKYEIPDSRNVVPFFKKDHISASGLEYFLTPAVKCSNTSSRSNRVFYRLMKIRGGTSRIFLDSYFRQNARSYSLTVKTSLHPSVATSLFRSFFVEEQSIPSSNPYRRPISKRKFDEYCSHSDGDEVVSVSTFLGSNDLSPLRKAGIRHLSYQSPIKKARVRSPVKCTSPQSHVSETDVESTPSTSSLPSSANHSVEPTKGNRRTLERNTGVPRPPSRFSFMQNDRFSLPFLNLSVSSIAEAGVKTNYEPLGNPVSLSQAEQMIRSDKTRLLALSAHSTSAVTFDGFRPSGTNAIHTLRVTPDIDSLDILTTSTGGCAFANSSGAVLLRWESRFNNVLEAQRKNNNFVYFYRGCTADVFPGNYFVNDSKVHFKFRSYRHPRALSSDPKIPLQLHIMQMRTSLSPESLKVFALFPSDIVRKLVHGNASVLKLFRNLVFPEDNSDINVRQTQCQIVWYMITELILFCVSVATASGSEMLTFSRGPCCAVPSPGNKDLHVRKHGQLSDYFSSAKFGPGVLTVALLYMSRFLRALEQVTNLPGAYQNHDYKHEERYSLPTSLLPLCANQQVMHCLSSPIGSDRCRRHFQQLWRRERKMNALMSFQSDPQRRGEHALPNSESNKKALESNHLYLEDLLFLNYAVFRATIHGTKASFSCSKEASTMTERFKDEINPQGLLDGIMDIGYTMRCPQEADFGVLAKSNSFSQRLFLPTSCKKSLRNIGAYLTTGPGFPAASGFATLKASAGIPDSSLRPSGIRRVKVYTTKWRADNVRGNSIYQSHVPKMETMLDGMSGLFESLSFDQNSPDMAQSRTSKRLSDLWNHYGIIEHNISSREFNLTKPQNGLGVRVEVTCFLDGEFKCLEKALQVLQLQEHIQNLDKQTFLSSVKESPENFPWWCAAPDRDLFLQRGPRCRQDQLPVIFVRSRGVLRLSTTLEKSCLQLSREIYEDAVSLSSRYGLAQERSVAPFMEIIFRNLPPLSFWRLTSLLCRGLLAAAKGQVDSALVNIRTEEVADTYDPVHITGVALSWSTNGIPKILCSRLLTSSPQFYQAYRALEILNPRWRALNPDRLLDEVYEDDGAVTERMRIPLTSAGKDRWSNAIQGRLNQWDGGDEDILRLWSVAQNTFYRSLKAATMEQRQALEECPRQVLRKECVRASVQLVVLLITDIFFELRSLGSGLSRYGLEITKPLLQREDINLEESMIATCTRLVQEDRPFPEYMCIHFGRSRLIRELESLQRCFQSDMNVNALDNSDSSDTLSSDNSIKLQSFIFQFWEHAKRIDSSLILLPEKGRRRKPVPLWQSLKFARVIVDVLAHNRERCLSRGIADDRLSSFFESNFANCFAHTLFSAGFDKLCPVFKRPLQVAGQPNSSLLATPLTFGCLERSEDFEMPLGMNSSFASLSNAPLMAQSSSIDSAELLEFCDAILPELKRCVRRRNHSECGSSEFRSETDTILEHEKRVWERNEFSSILMTILDKSLQQYKERLGMDDRTSLYIRRVIGDLINLRAHISDEGMGAYRDTSGAIRSVRETARTSQHEIIERQEFRRGRVFLQPWRHDLYPDPYDFEGQNRKNKNTKVRDAAPFLTICGFTFKAVRKEGALPPISYFRDMLVSDIFENFRHPNPSVGNAYWRLVPTTKLLHIVSEYLLADTLPIPLSET